MNFHLYKTENIVNVTSVCVGDNKIKFFKNMFVTTNCYIVPSILYNLKVGYHLITHRKKGRSL